MTATARDAIKQITGSGWSNPLTHAFYLEDSAHLEVWADNTQLTEGVDYTVADVGVEAGYEVTITTPGSWDPTMWVLKVSTPLNQETSLGTSPAGLVYEDGLDLIMYRMQVLAADVERSIKRRLDRTAQPEFVGASYTVNTVPKFDSDGNIVEGPSVADIEAAEGYADNAAASATAAAASASAASSSATAAASSAASAASSASTASTAATDADAAATDAETAQTAAEAAQTAAEAAQTAAEAAQTAAETAKTAAEAAQTAAEAAQTGAETAETNAANSLTAFYDWFIGAAASDPSVDLNGDPVTQGQIYWNTTSSEMRVYNGSTFEATYAPVSGYALLTGSTFTGDVTVQGAFTSVGIDDNATGERVQIGDNDTQFGTSGQGYGLQNIDGTQYLSLAGGPSTSGHANILLYGGTHASLAYDFKVRAGANDTLHYDYSASQWAMYDHGGANLLYANATAFGIPVGQVVIGENLSTGDAHIELGYARTGDGSAYIDLWASSAETDWDYRMIRNGGANGSMVFGQGGTGWTVFQQNGGTNVLGLSTADVVAYNRVFFDYNDNTDFYAYDDGTNPIINWDANDYIAYIAASNYWSFAIGGTGQMVVAGNYTSRETGGFREAVSTITASTTPAIGYANYGQIIHWTLSGNSTPTDAMANGDSITLIIDDGTGYTITWTSLVDYWIGGSAPTLDTANETVVELWKRGGFVYAMEVGVAS